MAFNNSLLERMNLGNVNANFYSCVADGATGTIVTGFQAVDAISVTYKSMTSGVTRFRINAGVSGTATAGTIAVTSAVNGDEFYVIVYGH
jgi:hypothetical protein